MEDKKATTAQFCKTLQTTRQFSDLLDLEYSGIFADGSEYVTAFFMAGGRKTINVSGDSCVALMQDVLKGLM